MKAKYIINEIRQDMESGLSAVGVGKSALTKTYEFLKKEYPFVTNNAEELDDIDLMPGSIKQILCKVFNTESDNVMGISDFDLASNRYAGEAADFLDWIDQNRDHNRKNAFDQKYETRYKTYKVENTFKEPWNLVRVRVYESYNSTFDQKYLSSESYILFMV